MSKEDRVMELLILSDFHLDFGPHHIDYDVLILAEDINTKTNGFKIWMSTLNTFFFELKVRDKRKSLPMNK